MLPKGNEHNFFLLEKYWLQLREQIMRMKLKSKVRLRYYGSREVSNFIFNSFILSPTINDKVWRNVELNNNAIGEKLKIYF